MIQMYAGMVRFQWHVLRGAITALRDGEEGMGTLEVLVIAAGLVALAAGAVVVFKASAQAKVNGVETPSAGAVTP